MKTTFLVLANNSDGLYGFRKELLTALARYGSVNVAVPDNGWFNELESIGCCIYETPVDRRGMNPLADLKLMYKYFRLIRSIEPDLVITYTIKPNIYGGIVSRILGKKYAVNITGLGTTFQKQGLLRTFVKGLYKTALKNAYKVFFENAGNMQNLVEEGIVSTDQCCLLNGAGVNLEHYMYAEYPTDSIVRFLFMGRIMEEKGVNELFSAMKRLRQEGLDCVLDVLGHYEEDYADQIRQYEAEGWLFYHGYQKDVRPFIEKCHCFVLPSWHEGMANTNLECAAMGRPIITSRIHGCMEAVLEGESGLLCDPQNYDGLYETMKQFLSFERNKKRSMGITGRRHMEAAFDKDKVVKETLEALRDKAMA